MKIYVHERSDETLVAALLPLDGRALPRTWGALFATGACEVDEDALSPWVLDGLRDEGYCAVAGRDATLIRDALQADRAQSHGPPGPPHTAGTAYDRHA